ncbi:MAG: CDP-glycerol glycerophosphotransferase family protein, partial [Enterococcus casseliflavus]
MKSWLLAKIKQSYLFTIKRFAKKNKKQHQQIVYLLSFPSTSNYIIEKLFQKYQKRLTICYTKNATDLARTYQEKG